MSSEKYDPREWEGTECPHCGTIWDGESMCESEGFTSEPEPPITGTFAKCGECGNKISSIALYWEM